MMLRKNKMDNKPKIMSVDIPIVKLTKEELEEIKKKMGITLNEEIFLKK